MCTCIIDEEVSLLCVEDFCGMCTHYGWSHPTAFWADWDGATVVHFGGAWSHVPDMTAVGELPTADVVHTHASLYGGHCQKGE